MKKIPLLTLFISLVFIIAACSKEKKFERMLYKGEGEWTITNLTYTRILTDESYETDTLSSTIQNAGTFEFRKNGVGSYNFIIGNINHHQSFSWNVINESSLTLTRNSENYSIFTDSYEYIVITMTGEKTGKNKMTVTGTEIYESETVSSYTDSDLTATFTLEKK